MSEEIRRHLSSSDAWLRVLLVLVFAAAFYLGTLVAGAVALLALVILLLSGERNQPLAQFGRQLGTYLGQIVAFATLGSDQKPFPFGPWPVAESIEGLDTVSDAVSDPDAAPVAPEPPAEAPPTPEETDALSTAQAPTAKKTAAKKSTRKRTSKKAVSKKSTSKSSGDA